MYALRDAHVYLFRTVWPLMGLSCMPFFGPFKSTVVMRIVLLALALFHAACALPTTRLVTAHVKTRQYACANNQVNNYVNAYQNWRLPFWVVTGSEKVVCMLTYCRWCAYRVGSNVAPDG